MLSNTRRRLKLHAASPAERDAATDTTATAANSTAFDTDANTTATDTDAANATATDMHLDLDSDDDYADIVVTRETQKAPTRRRSNPFIDDEADEASDDEDDDDDSVDLENEPCIHCSSAHELDGMVCTSPIIHSLVILIHAIH